MCRRGWLDGETATDMLAWERSGYSVDASVRIALVDQDVPSYSNSLEHLLRNPGKRGDAASERESSLPRGQGQGERATDAPPRSHDTASIASAQLIPWIAEAFPLVCPGCGRDIRLIAFITDPTPMRGILTHLDRLLEGIREATGLPLATRDSGLTPNPQDKIP